MSHKILYRGTPIDELSREELIRALEFMMSSNQADIMASRRVDDLFSGRTLE